MFWRHKSVDSDKEEEKLIAKKKKKRIRYLRRKARRLRVLHFIFIWYYCMKYKKKYQHKVPNYHELIDLLDKPYKVASYVFTCVKSIQDKDMYPIKKLIKGDIVTDKTVILFINKVLKYHGYNVYTFWMGYRASRLIPVSAIVLKYLTITIGPESYKIHIGDQFDITKDYFENGNRWIILNESMTEYIMSYSKGRIPEVVLYNADTADSKRPFAVDVMSKLKIKPISNREEQI